MLRTFVRGEREATKERLAPPHAEKVGTANATNSHEHTLNDALTSKHAHCIDRRSCSCELHKCH